ncbi:MAG: hypothetical protein JEZ04_13735 [Spirochaetales bacterium]|nr:hypothetical protein [Spirochaetales bacterium]
MKKTNSITLKSINKYLTTTAFAFYIFEGTLLAAPSYLNPNVKYTDARKQYLFIFIPIYDIE